MLLFFYFQNLANSQILIFFFNFRNLASVKCSTFDIWHLKTFVKQLKIFWNLQMMCQWVSEQCRNDNWILTAFSSSSSVCHLTSFKFFSVLISLGRVCYNVSILTWHTMHTPENSSSSIIPLWNCKDIWNKSIQSDQKKPQFAISCTLLAFHPIYDGKIRYEKGLLQ